MTASDYLVVERLEAKVEELHAEIARLRAVIGEWAQARAAMNGVKINTPECAEAFRRLGSAETALAETKP